MHTQNNLFKSLVKELLGRNEGVPLLQQMCLFYPLSKSDISRQYLS